jgi:hypothetical protein
MKKSTKTGKTFTQKAEIMNILAVAKALKGEDSWMTTSDIVDAANKIGWTTPMVDATRRAASHPYSKILSMMTDVTNPSYYSENVIWHTSEKKGKKIEYRLA